MVNKDGGQKVRRSDTAYGTVTEERLRALLDKDCEANSVVAIKRNKISRKHYSRELGCNRSSLTRYAYVFEEYEKKYGIVTGKAHLVPEMCDWINKEYEARKLDFRGGKLDRSSFRKYFGVPSDFLWRAGVAVSLLFDDLDARARNEGYISVQIQKDLERVQLILAGDLALKADRITINLLELELKSRVSKYRLQNPPFSEAISARQAVITAEVKASKIDPYIHGSVFVFSELTSLWPRSFLKRVGVRFKQITASITLETVNARHSNLVAVLKWIGSSNNTNCRAVFNEVKEHGRVLSSNPWEDALYAYREYVIAESASESMANSAITELRPTLAGLTSGGVLPATALPLPGLSYANYRRKHLRSIAEAVITESSNTELGYIEFARNTLIEAYKASTTNINPGESREFIENLAVDLKESNNLHSDPATAIRCLLESRLEAIRIRATEIIDDAMARYDAGQCLLARSQIDGEKFELEYKSCIPGSHKRRELVRKVFPYSCSADEQDEQGIINLLGLIQQRYAGVPPSCKDTETGLGAQFFSNRYKNYGGLYSIIPMLHPDLDAVRAVLTLYLIDTGANVSVGRMLDRDCLEVSDAEGHRRITGYKARAKGKPIIVDLPEASSTVRAIEWLLSASSPLQARAASDNNKLFLGRKGGGSTLIEQDAYRAWFKRFCESTPALENIHLVPNMLRPSVLLHASLSNDGRLATGMAIGQHGLSDTQGYQQKWPTRLLYDENIRRFHTVFETLVMSSIDDAAIKLNITTEQFEARMGNLRATGLGTFCRDGRGRPGEATTTCSKLDCWNDCPNLLIVAEVEAISLLQLWQASLREVQAEWERDRPERWDHVWLPWLCLTDVVEEKMARGPLLKIWRSALKRTVEQSTQANYVPPKPW